MMKEDHSTKKLRAEMMVSEKALWDAIVNIREQTEKEAEDKTMSEGPIKKLESQVEELRQQIEELKHQPDTSTTPRLGDQGWWVVVRDSLDENWEGPHLLADVYLRVPHYKANNLRWNYAKIVPGAGKIMMQEHDGSSTPPKWLNTDDKVIVQFSAGTPKRVRTPDEVDWRHVTRYQKLEIRP